MGQLAGANPYVAAGMTAMGLLSGLKESKQSRRPTTQTTRLTGLPAELGGWAPLQDAMAGVEAAFDHETPEFNPGKPFSTSNPFASSRGRQGPPPEAPAEPTDPAGATQTYASALSSGMLDRSGLSRNSGGFYGSSRAAPGIGAFRPMPLEFGAIPGWGSAGGGVGTTNMRKKAY